MIVSVTHDGVVALEDVDNFRAFKVAAACEADRLPNALTGGAGRLDADGHAWIARAWLLANGRPEDPQWCGGLEAMLAYAQGHGWVDEATDSIRAHVEWSRGR